MVQIEIVETELHSITFALEDGSSVKVSYDKDSDCMRVKSDNGFLQERTDPKPPFPASRSL